MVVLSIIGIGVALLLLYLLVEKINRYSVNSFNYEVFDSASAIISGIGYVLIYFGRDFYLDAIANHGDKLNGQVLMVIGAFFLLFIIFINFKRMGFFRGIFFSTIQMIIYAGVAVVGFFAVMIIVAALSNTRPVYNLNSK